MRKSSEVNHFYESYFKEASQANADRLAFGIAANSGDVDGIFASALQTLSKQVFEYQKNHEDIWYGFEGSLCISSALKQEPCFIVEGYGEDWYIEQLASVAFPIPLFDGIFQHFREESKRKAKPYVNKIHETEIDLEMTNWLRYTVMELFHSSFENAVAQLYECDDYLNTKRNEEFMIRFSPYRGMNQQIGLKQKA